MLTLSIHPGDAGDMGALVATGDEMLVVTATHSSICVDILGDGLASTSFDLRRRLDLGDNGEPIWTASVRAAGFPSFTDSSTDAPSSRGSSRVSADIRDEADD